jgi:heptaprenyl diphosphate synthase/octaprenyl-diphosphate synthase
MRPEEKQALQAATIFEPVAGGLRSVEKRLKDMASPASPFVSELLSHVLSSEGKMMRPAITLLAANFHPHETDNPITMATAVELLHIATLVHDDTVDDSDLRRGRATVSSLWGKHAAVLIGDYIFAASATYVCDTGNVRVIKRFAETIMELSTGELREMTDAFSPNQTRAAYLKRIYHKTASLFTTASESGAVLSGASDSTAQLFKDYGYNLGMAFQIVDDILDFEGTAAEFGKPVGSDLIHGVATLPAIVSMERFPADNPVPRYFETRDEADHASVIDLIQGSGIIEECYSIAEDYCNKSLKCLESLPASPSRDSLETLVGYVTERRK